MSSLGGHSASVVGRGKEATQCLSALHGYLQHHTSVQEIKAGIFLQAIYPQHDNLAGYIALNRPVELPSMSRSFEGLLGLHYFRDTCGCRGRRGAIHEHGRRHAGGSWWGGGVGGA